MTKQRLDRAVEVVLTALSHVETNAADGSISGPYADFAEAFVEFVEDESLNAEAFRVGGLVVLLGDLAAARAKSRIECILEDVLKDLVPPDEIEVELWWALRREDLAPPEDKAKSCFDRFLKHIGGSPALSWEDAIRTWRGPSEAATWLVQKLTGAASQQALDDVRRAVKEGGDRYGPLLAPEDPRTARIRGLRFALAALHVRDDEAERFLRDICEEVLERPQRPLRPLPVPAASGIDVASYPMLPPHKY